VPCFAVPCFAFSCFLFPVLLFSNPYSLLPALMSDLPVPDPNAKFRPQALDIQHDTDPAHDHGIARRIPHLGHALLFFTLALTFIFMASAGLLIALHTVTPAVVMQHPFAELV